MPEKTIVILDYSTVVPFLYKLFSPNTNRHFADHLFVVIPRISIDLCPDFISGVRPSPVRRMQLGSLSNLILSRLPGYGDRKFARIFSPNQNINEFYAQAYYSYQDNLIFWWHRFIDKATYDKDNFAFLVDRESAATLSDRWDLYRKITKKVRDMLRVGTEVPIFLETRDYAWWGRQTPTGLAPDNHSLHETEALFTSVGLHVRDCTPRGQRTTGTHCRECMFLNGNRGTCKASWAQFSGRLESCPTWFTYTYTGAPNSDVLKSHSTSDLRLARRHTSLDREPLCWATI